MAHSTSLKRYFEWVCSFINDQDYSFANYKKLLKRLYETEFIFFFGLDRNRASDGLNLRKQYEIEKGDNSLVILLENTPCSVLEMIVALIIRCKANYPNTDDGKSLWFRDIIKSLGLDWYTDELYSEGEVDYILKRFMNREYEPDGRGSICTLPILRDDLRKVDIWYQFNWYISYLLYGRYF